MYYELSHFYKRDVYFLYDDENNIESNEFEKGNIINVEGKLIYRVDKLDSYLSTYDILPTFNTPLVSKKFADFFKDLNLQFINITIIDKQGNSNNDYYILNVLDVVSCMDSEKSIVEIKKYGSANIMTIKKLYIIPDSLNNLSIIRMEEKKSYIIITEEFKKRCEEAGLKGVEFIEEGHSIYTE
ncbi:Imm43 family immunity protein [Flavobacterium ardleyense]|uniref:Imm43 family immunity protein n=1 Tax=Flavobacterium ardleyense TaxID=2038737 RepID=A0ABW5ZBQ6_9FLAO